jgi:protein associated with RNAse G/E
VTDLRTVRVLTRKWPDNPHWEFDAIRLGVDAHGQWVGVPKGTWLSRPDKGFTATADHVVLLPHDDWWVATLYGDDAERPMDVYVDMTTPCSWAEDGSTVTCVDLDLDVIRSVDGEVWIDDEDEFAEHQVLFGYPDDVVAGAEQSCAEVFSALSARSGAFDGVHLEWLARLRAKL